MPGGPAVKPAGRWHLPWGLVSMGMYWRLGCPWVRAPGRRGPAACGNSHFRFPSAGLIGFLFMLRALVAANFNTIYIYTAEVSVGEGGTGGRSVLDAWSCMESAPMASTDFP